MTALELNPDLFVVARQENPQNDELFDASGAHLVARRSLIVARRILTVATTPLLKVFLEHLVHQDERFAKTLERRLSAILGGFSPGIWTIELTGQNAESLRAAMREGSKIRLEHLLLNARSPEPEPLPCVCLMLERSSLRQFMPDEREVLLEGDRLLFAGRGGARREMVFSLTEPTTLVSLATGRHQPRGAIMRRLARKRAS
jgi:hypothetical protein